MKTLNVSSCAACPNCHYSPSRETWICALLGWREFCPTPLRILADCPLDDAADDDGKAESLQKDHQFQRALKERKGVK